MPAERSTRSSSRQSGGTASNDSGSSASTPYPSFPVPIGNIAFAPNVTPGTFNDPYAASADDEHALPDTLIFPPQSEDLLKPRKTHARKRPENYIPRPPNAFILFRSAFIRNQHVSTGVETSHSTLSKIIGLTWQNLPHEERQQWHRKAKQAEEQHRIKFPQYAFKPLHKRAGVKRKIREVGVKDHTRCAKIAELLVQGKKGQDLDDAIKEFDKTHVPQIVTRFEAPVTEQSFRRSSSVPVSDDQVEEGSRGSSRRASSTKPSASRRSGSSSTHCPSPLSTNLLTLPPSALGQSEQRMDQDPLYLNVPSFDQFCFKAGIKDEHTFDFDSFSFSPSIPSSDSLYQLDSHSGSIHPLDSTFVPPVTQPTLMLPRLSSDFICAERWSHCQSPSSPSTNTNSMPTTPANPGTPPPNGLFMPYVPQPTPDLTYDHKSSFDGMAGYETYQDSTPMYNGPVPFVESHCHYAPAQIHIPRSEHQQMDLHDYSSLMASMSSFST